jgi:hypothetical protein
MVRADTQDLDSICPELQDSACRCRGPRRCPRTMVCVMALAAEAAFPSGPLPPPSAGFEVGYVTGTAPAVRFRWRRRRRCRSSISCRCAGSRSHQSHALAGMLPLAAGMLPLAAGRQATRHRVDGHIAAGSAETLRAHVMPDHVGDRGAVRPILEHHDHLHINHDRASAARADHPDLLAAGVCRHAALGVHNGGLALPGSEELPALRDQQRRPAAGA